METYIWSYVKQAASGSSLHVREVKLVLCDNLEGGIGREVGEKFKREATYVYL